MNWESWGPTIVAAITAVFTAGLLTQTVKDQGKLVASHDKKITEHAISIAKLESWRDGYNAATNRADLH